MDAQTFCDALKARGLTFFSGVPDSTFHHAYNLMIHDPEIRYIPAVREDVALGVASAAYFTGKLGGVMTDANRNARFVHCNVVNSVGNRFAQLPIGKVVGCDFPRVAFGTIGAPLVLHVSQRFFLLRVDRDRGLARS